MDICCIGANEVPIKACCSQDTHMVTLLRKFSSGTDTEHCLAESKIPQNSVKRWKFAQNTGKNMHNSHNSFIVMQIKACCSKDMHTVALLSKINSGADTEDHLAGQKVPQNSL